MGYSEKELLEKILKKIDKQQEDIEDIKSILMAGTSKERGELIKELKKKNTEFDYHHNAGGYMPPWCGLSYMQNK